MTILRGDPGIGKTRLLEYAAATANEFRVVWVRGHEGEREIPFAALSMLVGPLLDTVSQLPPVQAAALEGALNLGPAVHGDRLGVAAATLAVLAAAAEERPLLLAVDDVHLLDQPSLEALFFALRRMRAERLAAVMTARTGPEVDPSVERWLEPVASVRLAGLDLDAARLLIADRGGLPSTVWAAASGNPLALLEMTAPQSAVLIDEPLHLSARLLRAYGLRLVGLPAQTRDALIVLAVAGRVTDVLVPALAHRGLTYEDLEVAEGAGLVLDDAAGMRFTHPLVRSAVYHSASPATKRAAHQALVAAYAGRTAPGATERRAFHLAAATARHDEAVARDLADAARAASARHSHTTAAALFERAARLTPPGETRTRRILDAAMAGQAAGTLDVVGPLLDVAIAESEDDDLRTAAKHLQCRIQMWSGRPAQARDQLLDLADQTELTYPFWSALMRSQAAVVSIALGEQRLANGMVRRAAALVGALDDAGALPVLVAQAVTLAVNGDTGPAREVLRRCERHLSDYDPLSIDQLLVLTGLAYLSLDETVRARHWLETTVQTTRNAQAVGLLPFQLSWLSVLYWSDGDWVGALAHAHDADAIAEETGWSTERPNSLIVLATIEAALGQDEDCRRHAELAVQLGAQQSNARIYEAHAARVLGLLELGAGNPEQAAEHLGVAGGYAIARGLGDPVLFSWAANLCEALVRCGRTDAAQRAHESIVREAARSGRQTEYAGEARCRGLMLGEDLDGGRSAFEEALRRHDQVRQPFERARTELCYGEFLRRHQRRVDARGMLGNALTTFRRLGASPWARRAESELQATGMRSRRRTSPSSERLTPQELQVALVVADGATNSEAATRLFLSTKTVEFHLSNAYRKLGVRSRVELARKVLSGLPEQAPPPGAGRTAASVVTAPSPQAELEGTWPGQQA